VHGEIELEGCAGRRKDKVAVFILQALNVFHDVVPVKYELQAPHG